MERLCSLISNTNKASSPQFRQTLNELSEALIKPETFKRDLFFSLLLIVIKENYFMLKGNTEINVVKYILEKRGNYRTIYEVAIVLKQYPETPANVIMCSLDDTMLINAIIDVTKEIHSLCLPINDYIMTSSLGIPSEFSNLDELIISFKEKIVIPVKSSILNYYSQPCGSLYGLPNDVLFQILLSLPLTDVLNIAESCKKLSQVVKDENLWSRLLRRDFPRMSTNKEADWHSVYKKAYKKKKKKLENAHNIRNNIIEEIAEWPDYMPVRDSRWELIL